MFKNCTAAFYKFKPLNVVVMMFLLCLGNLADKRFM